MGLLTAYKESRLWAKLRGEISIIYLKQEDVIFYIISPISGNIISQFRFQVITSSCFISSSAAISIFSYPTLEFYYIDTLTPLIQIRDRKKKSQNIILVCFNSRQPSLSSRTNSEWKTRQVVLNQKDP